MFYIENNDILYAAVYKVYTVGTFLSKIPA